MYPIIPKKLKGTYVFRPSDQTQGVLSNIMGQDPTTTVLPTPTPAAMYFRPGTGSDMSAPHSILPSSQFAQPPSSSVIHSPPSQSMQSPSSMVMQSPPLSQLQLPQFMHHSPMQLSSVQRLPSAGPSSLGSKCKGSSQSLPSTFVNDFMSTSGDSSHATGSQKRQKITGPAAILAMSDQLRDFNTTIKDFLGAKEASRRKTQRACASSSECVTMAMGALQEQDRKWLNSDLLIAMVDHFKLNIRSANTYMALQTQLFHRAWVKQLKEMNYAVDHLIIDDTNNEAAA